MSDTKLRDACIEFNEKNKGAVARVLDYPGTVHLCCAPPYIEGASGKKYCDVCGYPAEEAFRPYEFRCDCEIKDTER